MQLVEDGDDVTVATLEYPGAPLQCDAMVAEGGAADWTADAAVDQPRPRRHRSGLDRAVPRLRHLDRRHRRVPERPGAVLPRRRATNSPLGGPATIFHAEAVDGGRTYIYECLADTAIAADAKGLVDFLFANFSTRSDGECCIDPAATPE